MSISRRAFVALFAATMFGVFSPARAQQAASAGTNMRIRGDIEAIDEHEVHIISRRGEKYTMQLADDLKVQAIVPTTIDAIKPGMFVGSAAIPQPDGTLRAVEVHLFPESMRGTGEGHRPFDLGPQSTMTNGTVGDVIVLEGRSLKVDYKGGEKVIAVPPDTPIVALEPGGRGLLTPAAHVIVFATQPPGGPLTATRISVGTNGLVPPM